MPEILTTPDELHAAIERGGYDDGGPVRLLDVRWLLHKPDGRPDYLAGHIPRAVYVDLDTELAEHGAPTDGRHPLPSPERLQRAARRWGLHEGDTVVVYDGSGNYAAARAWWLLRHAGVHDVRLLDGALPAWIAAGHPVESGEHTPEHGSITLRLGALPVIELDAVLGFAADGTLLDARAPERYRGEVEPIDPRAGHIPGAISAPTGENLDAEGRFLPASELRARFESLGVRPGAPVGAYCGSGVTAAHEAVALILAGFEPALYPGSWSQWSNHPELPAATGA